MTVDPSSSTERESNESWFRRSVLSLCLGFSTGGCLRSDIVAPGSQNSNTNKSSEQSANDTESSATDTNPQSITKPTHIEKRWTIDSSEPFIVRIAPDGDTAFIAGESGVRAVTTGGGRVQWKRDTEPVRTAPTITDETLYVPGSNGTLYALSREDGKLRWKFQGKKGLTTVPLHLPKKDRLIVGAGESDGMTVGSVGESEFDPTYLYGLNLAGESVWSIKTAGGNPVSSTAYHDGVLYLRTVNLLEAFDPVEGMKRPWEPELGKAKWDRPNDVRYHTKRMYTDTQGIYVPTRDGIVSIGHDGNYRWVFRPYDSPTQYKYHRGILYIGSEDNGVYAISPDDGSQLWRVSLSSTITTIATVDKTLWCGDKSGSVSALGIDSGERLIDSNIGHCVDSLDVDGEQTRLVISPDSGVSGWAIDKR